MVGIVALGVLDFAVFYDGALGNGFWTVSSQKAYHMALYLAYGALGFQLIRG